MLSKIKIALTIFLLMVLFVIPIIATITATNYYSKNHVKEMKEYKVWRVHEMMKEYNYCPYCGEKIKEDKK